MRCSSPRPARRGTAARAGLDRRAARGASARAVYTYWGYLRNRWPRDAGLRIDHILASPSLQPRCTGCGVDKAVRGLEGASDHAPVWVEMESE